MRTDDLSSNAPLPPRPALKPATRIDDRSPNVPLLPLPLPPLPSPLSPSPLSIHDMTVAYQRRPVLWDVDYEAPSGKLVAIIGPNGAGKSTLIKAALGLVPRASGDIQFFGQSYRAMRSRIGYVPQRTSVDWDFPIDALGIVAMGLYRKIGWFQPVSRRYRQQALSTG